MNTILSSATPASKREQIGVRTHRTNNSVDDPPGAGPTKYFAKAWNDVTKIPREEVGSSAKAVLNGLKGHQVEKAHGSKRFYMTNRQLGKATGLSTGHARRQIPVLVAKGKIRVTYEKASSENGDTRRFFEILDTPYGVSTSTDKRARGVTAGAQGGLKFVPIGAQGGVPTGAQGGARRWAPKEEEGIEDRRRNKTVPSPSLSLSPATPEPEPREADGHGTERDGFAALPGDGNGDEVREASPETTPKTLEEEFLEEIEACKKSIADANKRHSKNVPAMEADLAKLEARDVATLKEKRPLPVVVEVEAATRPVLPSEVPQAPRVDNPPPTPRRPSSPPWKPNLGVPLDALVETFQTDRDPGGNYLASGKIDWVLEILSARWKDSKPRTLACWRRALTTLTADYLRTTIKEVDEIATGNAAHLFSKKVAAEMRWNNGKADRPGRAG